MKKSDLTWAPGYFDTYIHKVADVDLAGALAQSFIDLQDLDTSALRSLGEQVYAPGKWTIKDIVLHLADCERVIIYRAMRIARADKTNLPGFDEDSFVSNAHANKRDIKNILAELKAYRTASIVFIASLDEEALNRSGTANNFPLTARLLVNHLYGHHRHHLNILNERYLPAFK